MIDDQGLGHQIFPDVSADNPAVASRGTVHTIWWDKNNFSFGVWTDWRDTLAGPDSREAGGGRASVPRLLGRRLERRPLSA